MDSDRANRYGLLGLLPGVRTWGDAHPAGIAALQGLTFAVIFGVIFGLTTSHGSVWANVLGAALAGLVFGFLMWLVNRRRRRSSA